MLTHRYQTPSIEDTLKKTYHVFMNNPEQCIINSLLFGVAAFFAAVSVFGLILLPALSGGFISAMLRLSRGEAIKNGDFLGVGCKQFGTLLAANLAMISAITAGLLLGIIPGIYLMVRWFYVNVAIMDQGLTFSEAFTCSSAMTKGHWWEVFALWLIIIICTTILYSTVIAAMLVPAVKCLLIANYYDLGRWEKIPASAQ